MAKLSFTNLYVMLLLVVTAIIGPILFFVPFIHVEQFTPYYRDFYTGLFDLFNAEIFNSAAPLSKPFLIAGFIISLITIVNLFEYEPNTSKMPYWLHRLLRIIPLIGSVLGLVGALLQIKLYHYLVANYTDHTVTMSIGFYFSVILFSLIFLGFIGQIVREESTYYRWKKEHPLPIENP